MESRGYGWYRERLILCKLYLSFSVSCAVCVRAIRNLEERACSNEKVAVSLTYIGSRREKAWRLSLLSLLSERKYSGWRELCHPWNVKRNERPEREEEELLSIREKYQRRKAEEREKSSPLYYRKAEKAATLREAVKTLIEMKWNV